MGLYTIDCGDVAVGMIARPGSRNALDIDVVGTPFEIVSEDGWTNEGEVVEKVGRTTGWTGGVVLASCEDVTPTDQFGIPTGFTKRCSFRVNTMGGGDSGAAVFKILQDHYVEIRGFHHAGTGGCYNAVDERGIAFVACNQSIGSHLAMVDHEFNPDAAGTADLPVTRERRT